MKTLILNILSMLLLTSCLPDSLEKWEMDQPQELTGCSNISIQGQTICAEAASSELVAAGFSYPTIESNEDKLTLPTVVELSSISPEFIGAPEGATYFFTSVKASSPETWFDFSEYGLSLNRDTGEVTGTPTKFLPRTDVILKAYHVQSGQWLSYEFNMAIATNFDVEGRTLSYPFPDVIDFERLRLAVSDATIFSTCSLQTCFTTSSGVKGYVEHIDLERNLLFVKVKNTDRAGKDWEKEVINVSDNIENGNDFIASSSTVDEVVRTVDLSKTTHKQYNPYFNFGLDTESEEWKDLRWSISPLPPGGIRDGKQTDQPFNLIYKDDATPSNMGIVYWAGQNDPAKPQEYTISVKNSIGQILQTKVMLNFERPPEGLGVSNFALIQVNQYDKIYVGDYISTTEEDLAKVYHKTYASYDDADNKTQYKYYLMVKLLKGDFADKEEIDHFKAFSRSVATVVGEAQLVNNVLTVEDNSFGELGEDGEISDSDKKYVAYNGGDTASLKLAATSLQPIEVVNPYQFSVGLQVVDEEDNSGVVMGIYKNLDNTKTYVVIQPTKNKLASGKKIQLGRSTFDQTEESTDYIIAAASQELKNIFVLSSGNNPAKIDSLYDVTNSSSKKISQNKTFTSGGAKNIISLWSPVIKLWSEDPLGTDPSIDDTYKFTPGSDVYTYSRLSGVVNKRDKEENSIYIEMDQFGFLPHKEDPDANTTTDTQRPYYFTFSEYHQDKINLATDAQNQILENDMDKATNDDGNTGTKDINVTPIQLGMSPTFVVYRGENINIKSQTHFGGNMDYFLEPSPESLPAGITYDSTTGTLSGIPEEKMDARKYTITARNPLGSTSYDFYLQVKDRMFIENITVSDSDYMLHQMGQSRQHTDCQITEEQIKNFQLDERDILCTLDVPENDLRNSAVTLNMNIGNNICEYLQFTPYTFNYTEENHIYKKSGTSGILPSWISYTGLDRAKTALSVEATLADLPTLEKVDDSYVKVFREYSVPDGCNNCWHPELNDFVPCSGSTLESDIVQCDGDHSKADGPNCDDGEYIIRQITIGEDANPNLEEDIEDGFCGGTQVLQKTYTNSYINRDNSAGALFNISNKNDYSLSMTISTPNLLTDPEFGLGVYGLDYNRDGKINSDDDITGDSIAEYFIPAQDGDFDGTPGADNFNNAIHVKNYFQDSATGKCKTLADARADAAATYSDFNLFGTFLSTSTHSDHDNVINFTFVNTLMYQVTFNDTTGAKGNEDFNLIKQVDSFARYNGATISSPAQSDPDFEDLHYFVYDNNCDGEVDRAMTFDQLFTTTNFETFVYTGVDDGTNTATISGSTYGLIKNSEGKIISIDLDNDGFLDDENSTAGVTISSVTSSASTPWSEQEDPQEATSCGGSYGSCLMGQAQDYLSDEDIKIGIDTHYYPSISNFSQDFEFKNTDPTMPHQHYVSFDIANYVSSNSCSFSPNLLFENENNHFQDAQADNNLTANNDPANADLGLAAEKVSQVATFGASGNLLEELQSNIVLPYLDYAENLDIYTTVLGLGDLAVRDQESDFSVEIDNIQIPKMQVVKDDDDGDFLINELGGNDAHTTSYEIVRTSDNTNVDVHYVTYTQTDAAPPNGTKVEKINYFDQGVTNWAAMKHRSYIKIYTGITASLLANYKNAIGISLKVFNEGGLFKEIYARLEGYEGYVDGADKDYVIVSTNKSDEQTLITELLKGGTEFRVDSNDSELTPPAPNAEDNLFTVFAISDKNQMKYLPEILTTQFTSAHTFRPSPFYTFNCLDEAYDTKARITLQIREWNRHFTNGVDLDKTIPSARMDNNSIDLFGYDYNDYKDLDDILDNSYEGCFLKTPTRYNSEKTSTLIDIFN